MPDTIQDYYKIAKEAADKGLVTELKPIINGGGVGRKNHFKFTSSDGDKATVYTDNDDKVAISYQDDNEPLETDISSFKALMLNEAANTGFDNIHRGDVKAALKKANIGISDDAIHIAADDIITFRDYCKRKNCVGDEMTENDISDKTLAKMDGWKENPEQLYKLVAVANQILYNDGVTEEKTTQLVESIKKRINEGQKEDKERLEKLTPADVKKQLKSSGLGLSDEVIEMATKAIIEYKEYSLKNSDWDRMTSDDVRPDVYDAITDDDIFFKYIAVANNIMFGDKLKESKSTNENNTMYKDQADFETQLLQKFHDEKPTTTEDGNKTVYSIGGKVVGTWDNEAGTGEMTVAEEAVATAVVDAFKTAIASGTDKANAIEMVAKGLNISPAECEAQLLAAGVNEGMIADMIKKAQSKNQGVAASGEFAGKVLEAKKAWEKATEAKRSKYIVENGFDKKFVKAKFDSLPKKLVEGLIADMANGSAEKNFGISVEGDRTAGGNTPKFRPKINESLLKNGRLLEYNGNYGIPAGGRMQRLSKNTIPSINESIEQMKKLHALFSLKESLAFTKVHNSLVAEENVTLKMIRESIKTEFPANTLPSKRMKATNAIMEMMGVKKKVNESKPLKKGDWAVYSDDAGVVCNLEFISGDQNKATFKVTEILEEGENGGVQFEVGKEITLDKEQMKKHLVDQNFNESLTDVTTNKDAQTIKFPNEHDRNAAYDKLIAKSGGNQLVKKSGKSSLKFLQSAAYKQAVSQFGAKETGKTNESFDWLKVGDIIHVDWDGPSKVRVTNKTTDDITIRKVNKKGEDIAGDENSMTVGNAEFEAMLDESLNEALEKHVIQLEKDLTDKELAEMFNSESVVIGHDSSDHSKLIVDDNSFEIVKNVFDTNNIKYTVETNESSRKLNEGGTGFKELAKELNISDADRSKIDAIMNHPSKTDQQVYDEIRKIVDKEKAVRIMGCWGAMDDSYVAEATEADETTTITGEFSISTLELLTKWLGFKKADVEDDYYDILSDDMSIDKIKAKLQNDKDFKVVNNKDIKIGEVEFAETDSNNLSHSSAYYSVELTGKVSELKKVAGDDKDIFYDWDSSESVNESFRKVDKNDLMGLGGIENPDKTLIDDSSNDNVMFILDEHIGTLSIVSIDGKEIRMEKVKKEAAEKLIKSISKVDSFDHIIEKFDDMSVEYITINESKIKINEGKREGWLVSNDEAGKLMIQKDDDSDKFKNDSEALNFVKKKAKEGSEKHIKALKRIETANKKKK